MQRFRLPIFFAASFFVLFAIPRAVPGAELSHVVELYRTGKYAECAEEAGQAIADNAFDENYRLFKIRAEMELGRYADALQTLETALQKYPGSIQLRWLGCDVCRFNQQAERVEKLETEIVEAVKQFAWRYSDGPSQLVVGKLLLSKGADPKQVLTAIYNEVKRRYSGNVDVFLASGELALEKNDYQLAGENFQQAVKLAPDHPEAWYGVARAFAPSDPEKTAEALAKVLKTNPRHVPSLLLLVDGHVDAEHYQEAAELLDEVAQVNPHHPLALAYRAILAHLQNEPEKETQHRTAALKYWPQNPAVDWLIGKKLSQKYRFAEGAQYQQQALEADAKYLPAMMQLSQDLLRLGQEAEGLQLAEAVYKLDTYNVQAHNLVTLQEELAKFRSLEEDGLVVRMETREAEIYGQRVLTLLKRARSELCAKYDVELTAPIIVEIFPRQEDFAIRTFGMPGGAGFLGVCFGTVITANSPASQGNTPSCWESTLWHEFCHVVTLNKTHNKMPRWLSEGISVYEERQADPRWGQSMNPKYREMILGDDLTPVSQLSGAFLNPKSGLHLQFAYFESSLVVEFLIEKYGLESLQRVLTDLGVGMPINEALARDAGSIEALDTDFADYARNRAKALAPQADWAPPELPRRASVELIQDWLKDHPQSYVGLHLLAERLLQAEKWEEARLPLEQLVEMYPEASGEGNPYTLLAQVFRKLGENKSEREVLEKLAELTDDDVATLDRLTEVTAAAGDFAASRKYAERWLAINPLRPEPHRRAAAAAEQLQEYPLAIESYEALLRLDPFDPAEVHYQLARTYHAAGQREPARKHVLLSLAETPRYRAAQQLLLELVGTPQESEATP